MINAFTAAAQPLPLTHELLLARLVIMKLRNRLRSCPSGGMARHIQGNKALCVPAGNPNNIIINFLHVT